MPLSFISRCFDRWSAKKKKCEQPDFIINEPEKKPSVNLVPRVRVVDNETNRENAHWRELIGREGVFLGSHIDDEGETWDVQLEGQPIPHSLVNKDRFEMLPSISDKVV